MKTYYPDMKIAKTLNVKSIYQLAKECNIASSTASALVNGVYAMDLDNPKHKAFYNALRERADIIDKAIKNTAKDELIRIDSKVYRADDIINNRVKVKGL